MIEMIEILLKSETILAIFLYREQLIATVYMKLFYRHGTNKKQNGTICQNLSPAFVLILVI
jgi:hypothetical protein